MANKAIKFSSLTALLTAIGNKVIKKSETVELTALDIDSTPTSGSTNLVTSGGVKEAISTPIVTPTAGQASYTIDANKITKLGQLASAVTLSLNAGESGKVSIYDIIFSTGATAPTITWPNGITWAGGSAPTINAGKSYEVSISENLALISEF